MDRSGLGLMLIALVAIALAFDVLNRLHGAAKRVSAVRWNVASGLVWAWVITMPAAGAIAAGLYFLARLADRSLG